MKAIRLFLIGLLLTAAGCGRPEQPPREVPQEPVAGVVAPDFTELVQVKASQAAFSLETRGFVIVIEAVEGDLIGTTLPIVVGQREAGVLNMKLSRQSSQRPLTHDLALKLVSVLGGTLEHVVVEDLRDGIFLARVYLKDGDGVLRSADSRASDAIILGTASGVKIHMARKLLDELGTKPERARQSHTLI